MLLLRVEPVDPEGSQGLLVVCYEPRDWLRVARWCPLLAAPVPPGVCDLLPGAWRRFFPGLANGKSSILTGLCWGLPNGWPGGVTVPLLRVEWFSWA